MGVKVKAPMMKFVFGSLKCDDENAKEVVDNQVVDEQAAKKENEAPACVTVKKIDAEEMKKFMEEFNKKWEELKKQIQQLVVMRKLNQQKMKFWSLGQTDQLL